MVALRKSFSARSDLDWREAKARAAVDLDRRFAGFIFVCNNLTVPDLDRQLFGLPAHHEESVRAIRKGMPLFLYNYSTRLLHGVFEAVSDGGYNLDPRAWENTDISKIGRAPVSRYPAQVKVCVRAMRPPLDEETFRPILDHQEGHKFRLELTGMQVQQLLQLFGGFGSDADWENTNGLNNHNVFHQTAFSQQPESPNCVCKSDSDSCSVSSGGGTSFYEDEWSDETYFENADSFLSSVTNQLTMEDLQGNYEVAFEKQLPRQLGALSYSAALMSGMHTVSQENRHTTDGSGTLKGSLRRSIERTRPESLRSSNENSVVLRTTNENSMLLHPSNENSVLLRLQDVDPAVNSNSMNCLQSGGVKRQDTLNATPLFQSQLQPPFVGGENVVFIPIPTVHCQQTSVSSLPLPAQRTKWGEPRKFVRGWSGQNFGRQFLNQDKLNRQKDSSRPNYCKPYISSEPQQQPSVQSQNFQLGQVFVPLCPVPLQEQGHLTVLSSMFLAPPAPSSQPDIVANAEDGQEICDSVTDGHLQNRDGLQGLVQAPVFLMPSFMQRIPCQPSLMAEVNVAALHYEILDFAKMARPCQETRLHAEAAIGCVRNGVRRVWPDADVEVFGSFATGLCLRHSDVDLAVVGAPFPSSTVSLSVAQTSASLIRELARVLRTYYWCESITVIDTASMPVLKCFCRPADSGSSVEFSLLPPVAIDITIGGMRNTQTGHQTAYPRSRIGKARNKHTGGAAREYVLQRIWDLPALSPLVLLLKSYLHHKGLSDVYSGGLGSYSLTLLLAFYLERVPIPCELLLDGMPVDPPLSPTASSPLSCTSEFSEDSDSGNSSSSCGSTLDHGLDTRGGFLVRRAANVVDRVLAAWRSSGSSFLGTLLLGFLQTFGFELDLSTAKIVLKSADAPGGAFPRDSSTRHMALWIDDPLRPGVNVGAGSYGMCHVQAAFREMLHLLTNRQVFIAPSQNNERIYSDMPEIQSLHYLSRLFEIGDY
eukprot:c29277_g2_i1 orf=654-3620(+)